MKLAVISLNQAHRAAASVILVNAVLWTGCSKENISENLEVAKEKNKEYGAPKDATQYFIRMTNYTAPAEFGVQEDDYCNRSVSGSLDGTYPGQQTSTYVWTSGRCPQDLAQCRFFKGTSSST